ncbi:MAG: sensor histidine kinase [Solirubrobacteraceae bacterium]
MLRRHQPELAARGLELDASVAPVVVAGDRRLIERLVSNLLDNAIRHNLAGGRIQVRVDTRAGAGVFAICNTGPLVASEHVPRLLAPFQHLAPDRVGSRDGLGLGLSIVAAIATAHGATLDIRPGENGGLSVQARFPQVTGDGRREAVMLSPERELLSMRAR